MVFFYWGNGEYVFFGMVVTINDYVYYNNVEGKRLRISTDNPYIKVVCPD